MLAAHEYSGKRREIARRAKLHPDDVKLLIDEGIPRLHLPAIKDHIVDRQAVELELQQQRQANDPRRPGAIAAATERAISEAAVAQDLLSSAATTGVIIGSYIEQLAKGLASGSVQLAVPEVVTPELLETLAKVADANSRTVERAVKLTRLAKGMPTADINHRIVALISECTTEELRHAELTGGIPKRLLSTTSADPMEDGAGAIGINTKNAVIDVEFAEGEEPSWLADIAEAEGKSTDRADGAD